MNNLDAMKHEYEERLHGDDVTELFKAPTYAMIIEAVENEKINPDILKQLDKEKDKLGYLRSLVKVDTPHYHDVVLALCK